MGYIPPDARWYIAEIVLEIHVEDDPRNVVHLNSILVEANSPDEAYEKALVFGSEQESEYRNSAGHLVRFTFRGLRDLAVIHDGLEDGSELFYDQKIGITEKRIRRLVSKRDKLSVFAPIQPTADVPDYSSGDIIKQVQDLLTGFSCPGE
jgi:hypothetical protein